MATTTIKDLWCVDEEVDIGDNIIFFGLLATYCVLSLFGYALTKTCRKKKTLASLDRLEGQRWFFAEWVGRYPFVNFLLMATMMIALSGLAIFTKVSGRKAFHFHATPMLATRSSLLNSRLIV